MGNYNDINIALDVFSAFITIMIGSYLISRRNRTKENYCFIWICVLNLLFILGDLSDWCCNGTEQPWYPVALHVGQFVYYTVCAPLVLTLLMYVTEYLSRYTQVSRMYMRIAQVIAVLHLTGCFVTPFTGLYYTITDENIYKRGELVLLASVLPVAVYTLTTLMCIRYRKVLKPRIVIALLSYVWIPLLGQGIQFLFRGVATLNPAITLSVLFIFFNIQLDRDIQHEKDKQELTEANIRVMLSQIQPHFLYNTLAAIRGMCETDPARAKEAINDLSLFLRVNMDSLTNDRPIPFEQELRHVRSYLNLEQYLSDSNLNVEYDIGTTYFCVPALSLQPLVENAVQKGIRKKEGGGTVVIRTEETEQHYRIVVSDDGTGFDTGILTESGHIGIKNVRKRLEVLCGGTLDIRSVQGKGTTVCISMPKGS